MKLSSCPDASSGSCVSCLKKVHSLFYDLSSEELAALNQHRTVVSYSRGELIYKEGSLPPGLLCLNAGRVKVVQSDPKGTERIVALKKPVDFIDVRALLSESPYRHSAVALEDSSVCIMDKADFHSVVRKNPELSMRLMRMFIGELNDADRQMQDLTRKHLRARLASAILHVEDIFGTLSDGQTIPCMLKRSDLAGLSNMTTANVIRTLSRFEKEGLVKTVRKRLVLLDHTALLGISRENGPSAD